MLKKLKRIVMKLYWIDDKGDKHEGFPPGLSGDVDDCEIKEYERENGINITDLIE